MNRVNLLLCFLTSMDHAQGSLPRVQKMLSESHSLVRRSSYVGKGRPLNVMKIVASLFNPLFEINPSGLRPCHRDGIASPFPHRAYAVHGMITATRAAVAQRKETPPPLTLPWAAEMLEATFVKACMELSRGDVTMLKLFIAAAVGSYRLGAPLPEVFGALSHCDEKNMTANRPLAREETELRELWISLIYLTLELAELPVDAREHPATSVGETIRKEYAVFVSDIRDRVTTGAALNELSIDGLLGSDLARTPIRKAVLSQSIRVVYLTLKVLDEEAEAAGKKTASPFIPGTGPKRGDGLPAW